LKFVDEASREGLRTLLIASKTISEEELQIFLELCHAAESDLEFRDD